MTQRTVTIRGAEYAPVDSVAARVVRPAEAPPEPSRYRHPIWEAPPPHGPPPFGVPDLTGQRAGHMTIIGFLLTRPGSERTHGRGRWWLARCDCGRYEARGHHTWRQKMRRGVTSMCQRCWWLRRLQAQTQSSAQGGNRRSRRLRDQERLWAERARKRRLGELPGRSPAQSVAAAAGSEGMMDTEGLGIGAGERPRGQPLRAPFGVHGAARR